MPLGEDKALAISRIKDLIRILQDNADIQELVDGVTSDTEFKWCVFMIIKLSSVIYEAFPEIALVASRVITILNYARESFSGMNLVGIHIPKAKLISSLMYATKVSNADLLDVNFNSAVLDYMNASYSHLNHLFLGEEPVLFAGNDEPISSIAFNATGKLLAPW